MFTVKHVTPIGNEALYAATEVTFSREESLTSDAPGVLWVRGLDNNEPLLELRSGRAFVMNANGSTVASYQLVEDFGYQMGDNSQTVRGPNRQTHGTLG